MTVSLDQCQRMPKVDLHLHLEGAISAECLYEIAKRNGLEREVPSVSAARSLMQFSTPKEFFQQFMFVSGFIRTAADIGAVADDLLRRLTEENVLYAEITLAPRKFIRAGIPYPALLCELERAAERSKQRGGTEARYIMDMVRNLGPDRGMELLDLMEQYPSPWVVGVGLGGGEGYPPELFVVPYRRAKEMGLHRTVHAGEGAGPPSIWGALERLDAERIDHGTRAGEDPKLVEYLAEHRIPLNMCLTSNLALGVVSSLAEHPAWKYSRAGIPVTLGTDDPSFFKTTLSQECFLFAQTFDLSMEDLRQIQRNALGAAFLAEKDPNIGAGTGQAPPIRILT
ncbi:MAG TPA: adenosine deaminase [bacterium]|nr:adenosine deaminase [bacterium]HQL62829.1 adenosine deaminase [bacterium]